MAIGGIDASRMRFFGLASGMDVDEIVSSLMSAERVPVDRLLQRRQILQWQQEDYRQINRLLREVRDAALSLRLEQTFLARSASSSHESHVRVNAATNAALGSHSITVHQLAEPVRFHSQKDITPEGAQPGATLKQLFGEGVGDTVTFEIYSSLGAGGTGASHEFTLSTDLRLQDVAAAINSANLGLQAFYDPQLDRFFLSTTETGEVATVVFLQDSAGVEEGDEGFLRGLLHLSDGNDDIVLGELGDNGKPVKGAPGTYTGKDAKFDFAGATNLTSSTNEFTIGEVTYTLLKADPSTEVTVRVDRDPEPALAAIKAFVEKYNEAIDTINRKLEEKRYYDYPPLTDAQREEMSEKEIELWEERARSGLLRGDSLLFSTVSNLRMALGGTVDTGSPYTMLASIGITTGSWEDKGRLTIDESKLRQALLDDPEGVAALFRQDGTGNAEGLARRLGRALDAAMNSITERVGSIDSPADRSTIGRQIGWINSEIERAERRLQQREVYYYRQFSLLETFISQANTQSLWLAQTFLAGAM